MVFCVKNNRAVGGLVVKPGKGGFSLLRSVPKTRYNTPITVRCIRVPGKGTAAWRYIMADYYYYRKKIENQKRRRNAVVALLLVMVLLCAAAGYFWFRHEQGKSAAQPAQTQQEVPAPTATPATPESATPESATPESAAPFAPQRLLPAVEASAWDKSEKVEQTIDFEYLNTDARMVALPASGRVSREHFNTATFLGDSITEGMAIYDTGYTNAQVRGYRSSGPQIIVNNSVVHDYARNVDEAALDAVVASQPDFLYVLFGTNALTSQGGEDSFIAYYDKMIEVLQQNLPGVAIYIQAIPGVQETVVQSKPGLDNMRIQGVNNRLANIALVRGCYFVNIQEALTYPDGSQIDDYQTNDGIHMNPSGYAAWAEYLATHTAWDRRNKYEGASPFYILGS